MSEVSHQFALTSGALCFSVGVLLGHDSIGHDAIKKKSKVFLYTIRATYVELPLKIYAFSWTYGPLRLNY